MANEQTDLAPDQDSSGNPSEESNEDETQMSHEPASSEDRQGTDLDAIQQDASELDRVPEENQEFLVEQVQRARAELENFRRRTLEERALVRKRTVAEVFRTFLPLLDGLSAALKVESDDADGADGIRDGLRVIHENLDGILDQLGIEAVISVGADFDPEVHEAMLQVDHPDARNGEVVEEVERGYRFGDHLIRAARVIVCRTAQAPEGA
ncbi:MAG TPA: nucleotide exchange factor GrpE [Planctomycetes bacterium]|nr:nucleotide exchange factor GrpE [Planctomycetota bacterium]HIK81726.1 nucleotide exchange factor GrpE [Planctomycetota bacterium]